MNNAIREAVENKKLKQESVKLERQTESEDNKENWKKH